MPNLPKATSILVWLAALTGVLYAGSQWYGYLTYQDDPQSFDPFAGGLVAIYAVVGIAAAVTYIVWLRRVRAVAEHLTKAPHRHSKGWVIGGWFVPIIAFWYPKQIVDDIVAASDPRTSPQTEQLPQLRLRVVTIWWATWIASNVVEYADPGTFGDQTSGSDLLTAAVASSIAAVLSIVSAVYAVRVIQLITDLQASRPHIAWWLATPAPASTN